MGKELTLKSGTLNSLLLALAAACLDRAQAEGQGSRHNDGTSVRSEQGVSRTRSFSPAPSSAFRSQYKAIRKRLLGNSRRQKT
jgi:hypothetical protein